MHEYSSSKKIDGAEVALTVENGGAEDVRMAAQVLRNYREMVEQGLQIIQIKLNLRCDKSSHVLKYLKLMDFDLSLIPQIKARREGELAVWQQMAGWDTAKAAPSGK